MTKEKLKELRKKLKLSQTAVAEELFTTKQTVSNWECGRRKMRGLVKHSLTVFFEREMEK